MNFFLTSRQPDLNEKMDDPDCDQELLFNTYRSFKAINSLLAGWTKIYKREIRPFLEKNNGKCSILDIGVGGGDVPEKLISLAKNDGYTLKILAIDPNERAIGYAERNSTSSEIKFRQAYSSDLIEEKETFDFVLSNHLLHHLSDEQILRLCDEATKLSSHKVLFNDIRRSDAGYVLFFLLSKLFFHRSFISYDGLISIKRSFIHSELEDIVSEQWIISRFHPFRLLLKYEKS